MIQPNPQEFTFDDPDYDIPASVMEDIFEYQRTVAIGGRYSPEVYDPDADVDFDIPEDQPELRPLYTAFAARQSESSFERGILETVDKATDPPNTSIGRVFLESQKEEPVLGSCCRVQFKDPQANALVGFNKVLSSAHLFWPPEKVLMANVRFVAADGNKYDYSVQKIGIPKAYTETSDRMERWSTDYSVLSLAPLNGAPDLADVVPALPATLGKTLELQDEKVTKVGYGRFGEDIHKLLQHEGQFNVDLAGGKLLGFEGACKRGMSGGPALQQGQVVGLLSAGQPAHDFSLCSRVYLPELENLVECELEDMWHKSESEASL